MTAGLNREATTIERFGTVFPFLSLIREVPPRFAQILLRNKRSNNSRAATSLRPYRRRFLRAPWNNNTERFDRRAAAPAFVRKRSGRKKLRKKPRLPRTRGFAPSDAEFRGSAHPEPLPSTRLFLRVMAKKQAKQNKKPRAPSARSQPFCVPFLLLYSCFCSSSTSLLARMRTSPKHLHCFHTQRCVLL